MVSIGEHVSRSFLKKFSEGFGCEKSDCFADFSSFTSICDIMTPFPSIFRSFLFLQCFGKGYFYLRTATWELV